MTGANNSNTFKTQRDFIHPAAEIYAAFANGDKLARWWGPEGFSNTFHQFEFKQDGLWQFTMHGPDGNSYPNESYFSELIPAQKIVIRHNCMPFFTLSIELQALSAGTRLVWQQTFDDAAVAAALQHIVEPANEQNLDRLQRVLNADFN
ncbi:MAG: SRPBCC domain-containing protein [Oceanospirillaceae bacterium]|nr:SRPBCC domain-containing protein [Oceanospirillaceae bacterium]